jgi:cytochrome o ubiquinol oxidase subunit 2
MLFSKLLRSAAQGASRWIWSVLDPKGPVGAQELHVLVTALGLMMVVAVPVIVLTLWFAWRYRASSQTARFTPDWTARRRSHWSALPCR